MTRTFAAIVFCLAFLLAIGRLGAAEERPRPLEFAFDTFDARDWYRDWTRGNPSQVSRVSEQGVTFVRLRRTEPGSTMIERSIPLQPGWTSLLISARLRGKGIVPGPEGHETPMVQVLFFDADGKQVGGWPTKMQLPSDAEWHVQQHRYTIPENARTIRLQLWLMNCTGTLDVDWLRVQPLLAGQLPDAANQPLAWDFENVAGPWPAGWTRGDPREVSIVSEQGNHLLRIERRGKEKSAIISRELYLAPDWTSLTISARLRASGLDKGTESWMTGNVQVTFRDADGKQVGGWPRKLDVQSDTDWVERSHRYDIPPGARVMILEVGLWGAAGRFDVDDLRVTPHVAGELPGGETPRWGEEPTVEIGPHRGEVVLNGLWRFCPATIPQPEPKNWGWIRVPSNWQATSGPGVVARGSGWMDLNLRELPAARYERSIVVPREWSGRAILLRLERVSTDAVVFLDGNKAGTVNWPSGEVDLTSLVKPGQKQQLAVEVFASSHDEEVLEFMETMDLQVSKKKSVLDTRGLIGDVVLHSRPAAAHVSDLAVRTSVERKRLELLVELQGVRQAGTANVVVDIVDASNGQLARRFTATVDLPAGQDGHRQFVVGWDWPDPKLWDINQPNLYTLRLTIEGAGVRDSQQVTFGFREFRVEGRGFVLNGKPIRLRPMLAPNNFLPWDGIPEVVAGRMEGLRKAGFNFLEIWPNDISRRGSENNLDAWYREADRQGILVSGVLPSVNTAVVDTSWKPTWNTERGKPAWTNRVVETLRWRKNHPSVVMWAISGNFFGHPQDQNPRYIGRRGVYPETAARAAGRDAIEVVRQLDPTRVPFTHQGSDIGDIHTVNMYLNLIPLQEREQWLSEWAAKGEMPFMPVEFGVPQFNTFLRGRNGFRDNILTEPWLTEYAAIYLGSHAYAIETPQYREGMVQRLKQGQEYSSWHAGSEVLWQSPAMQAITSLFSRNTWRSWRAWGITGGMIPWDNGYQWAIDTTKDRDVPIAFVPGQRGRHVPSVPLRVIRPFEPPLAKLTETGHAIQSNNQPTLAFIAGDPKQGLADKDHLFEAGQTVAKQLVFINDARESLPFKASWTAFVGDEQVGSGTLSGRLEPAENRLEPITFDLPDELPEVGAAAGDDRPAGGFVPGRIELVATIGDVEHRDRFDLRVHAKPVFPGNIRFVQGFDPRGRTTAMLRHVGVELRQTAIDRGVQPEQRLPGDGLAGGPQSPIFVVGRQALDDDPRLLGRIEAFAVQGGTIVVFAQSPETLKRWFSFRVSPHLSRRVFPVSAEHPVTRGLDEESLRDWNSASTLVEPYPRLDTPDTPIGASSPYHGWRWGNDGSVATAAIEKPHHSGWTPILQCEFDLAYSPLMELRVGGGRVIWCQLDLEDQVETTPTARRLLRQLLEYAVIPSNQPPTTTARYLGGESDLALLRSLSLEVEPAGTIPAEPGLLVVGRDANVDADALRAFVARSGCVLLLPRPPGDPLVESLGLGIESRAGFLGSPTVPAWAETAGLSPSDLRLRNSLEWPVLVENPRGNRANPNPPDGDDRPDAADGPTVLTVAANGLVAVQRIGQGSLVLTQIDPRHLPADEKTYFRFSRWRQARALSQLLANLGGRFHSDRRIFSPVDAVEPFVDLSGGWRARFVRRVDDPRNEKHPDPGVSEDARRLCQPDVNDDAWDKIETPGSWEDAGGTWASANGEAVFRKVIDVPASLVDRPLVLSLGAIDDRDETYVNGVKVGGTPDGVETQWNVPRRYELPAGLVRAGRNVIAVRVWDQFGGGGFNGPAKEMRLVPVPRPQEHPLYHRDYRDDFPLGDDPYRYYRW